MITLARVDNEQPRAWQRKATCLASSAPNLPTTKHSFFDLKTSVHSGSEVIPIKGSISTVHESGMSYNTYYKGNTGSQINKKNILLHHNNNICTSITVMTQLTNSMWV